MGTDNGYNARADHFLASLFCIDCMGVSFIALVRALYPAADPLPFGVAAWDMIVLSTAIYLASHGVCGFVRWLAGNGTDMEV